MSKQHVEGISERMMVMRPSPTALLALEDMVARSKGSTIHLDGRGLPVTEALPLKFCIQDSAAAA